MRTIFDGKLVGETVTVTFTFGGRLANTESITSSSVAATTYSGTDAAASSIISGASAVAGETVTQTVTAGVLGVTYKLVATANTNLGQVLQQVAWLTVVPDTL
jgi:hypothetical protein